MMLEGVASIYVRRKTNIRTSTCDMPSSSAPSMIMASRELGRKGGIIRGRTVHLADSTTLPCHQPLKLEGRWLESKNSDLERKRLESDERGARDPSLGEAGALIADDGWCGWLTL
jgi:hypothetical protein